MTLTPEVEAELEAMVEDLETEGRESTPLETPPKESLPTTEELEQEAAAKKEAQAQKTLEGNAADPSKLKKNGTAKKQKTAEDLELEWSILERLGFKEFDDRAEGKGLKYKLKLPTSILDEPAKYPKVWITRKYSNEQPNGRFSAVPLDDDGKVVMSGEKPAFLAREDCMKLPPIANFYACRDTGYIPPAVVIGRLVRTKGDSRCVEIGENQGEVTGRRISYPKTLINKNQAGDYFIPANLNIVDTQGRKRMDIPRELVIEHYKDDEARLLAEESEQQRTKAKEEPPEYVPDEEEDEIKIEKVNDMENEVDVKIETDYVKQAKQQVHSIRETFEICYDEAAEFVAKKIAERFPVQDKGGDSGYTAYREQILEDFRLRIAQGFNITHQQNQRSGRY